MLCFGVVIQEYFSKKILKCFQMRLQRILFLKYKVRIEKQLFLGFFVGKFQFFDFLVICDMSFRQSYQIWEFVVRFYFVLFFRGQSLVQMVRGEVISFQRMLVRIWVVFWGRDVVWGQREVFRFFGGKIGSFLVLRVIEVELSLVIKVIEILVLWGGIF